MDRGKRHGKTTSYHALIYMDLKDIIRENALRFLPAKSIFKCRSVCKDWKHLISTPFFAHNQTFFCRSFSGIFCQMPGGAPTFIPLDANAHGVPDPSLSFLPEPVDIRCSSNGLLCCQDRTSARSYYICNPVTKQWKKLPQPNSNHGSEPAIVLIFEPSLLSFEAEFKLVCAFQSPDFDGLEFEIYSSTQGSWRVSGEICFGNRVLLPRTGVYADGVVYWMTNFTQIFGFDLAKERSVFLPGLGSLGVVNGKLCSFKFGTNAMSVDVLSNAHMSTMTMGYNESGWKKMSCIRFNGTGSSTGPTLEDIYSDNCVQVTDYAMTGKPKFHRDVVLFSSYDIVVVRAEKMVVAHDLKTNASTVLMAPETGFQSGMRFTPYVNSLVYL